MSRKQLHLRKRRQPLDSDSSHAAGMSRGKPVESDGKSPDGKQDEACCETPHLEEKAPYQSRKQGNMQIGHTDGDGLVHRGPDERF